MDDIQKLVPPFELCRKIPAGSYFEESFFAWSFHCDKRIKQAFVDRRTDIEYCRRNMVNAPPIYPAPTLQEILQKLHNFYFRKYTIIGTCSIAIKRDPDTWSKDYVNYDPTAAALELWLDVYAGEQTSTDTPYASLDGEEDQDPFVPFKPRPIIQPTELVYIAGPMTGKPIFNYPKFYGMAAMIERMYGCTVMNPARQPAGLTYDEYLRRASVDLFHADVMVLLEGWRESHGAVNEYEMMINRSDHVAIFTEKDVIENMDAVFNAEHKIVIRSAKNNQKEESGDETL